MNDKKKIIVVIALAVAVLGVGAFQFVNMSGGEKPQAKAEEKPKAADEQTAPAEEEDPMKGWRELYAMNARDPFQEGVLPPVEGTEPPPQPEPERPSKPPKGNGGNFYVPPGLGGTLPPVNPGGPGLNVVPTNTEPQPEELIVAGVITGAKPAAVIIDGSGKQRLVTLGSSINGDSRLVGVDKGRVSILHKDGKIQTLHVGGTPNVK